MPRPKGLPKTGGRKPGTSNRMTREVREAILRAFDQVGGEDYLVQVARDDPNDNAPDLTGRGRWESLEHETGLEPATTCLGNRFGP